MRLCFCLAAILSAAYAQSIESSFFGSGGSEMHVTPPDPRSPLNPGNALGIQRRTESVDVTLFGDIAPTDRRWKFHMKLGNTSELRRDSTSQLQVDELSFKFAVASWLDIRAGRSIERWGSGYAWNPTGVVNPRKDPADPNDRRNLFRGVDMAAADLFLKGWNVTLMAVPEIDWSGRHHRTLVATGWAARAYRLVKGTDLAFSATGGNGLPNSYGLNLARVFGNALELHGESAYITDAVRAAPRQGELVPIRRPHLELLLGGQYTFSNHVNLVAEYYQSGQGFSGTEWRDYRDFTALARESLAAGDPRGLIAASSQFTPLAMSKRYSFFRVLWPIRLNRLELETIVITSLQDGSSVVRPGLTWRIRPDWSVYWIQSQFVGNGSTEFGHIPIKWSADIGIRYQFAFGRKSGR